MKKSWIAGIALIVVVVVAGLFYPFHGEKKNPLPAQAGSAVADKENAAPEASSAAPPPAGSADALSVEVPIEKQRLMGIAVTPVEVRAMKKALRTVGRVEADERKLTTVNMKVDGWVETLHANYTGQHVRKGAPLAEIYSPELMALQLELINLKAFAAQGGRFQRNIEVNWGDRYGTTGRMTAFDTESLFRVAKQKLGLWDISEEQVKKVEETGEPIRTFTVKSPAEGYVFQKPVVKGTRIAPGEKLFDIVDLSTVWVLADIYEYEIPFVKVGQAATITMSYFPDKEFTAKVDFIYPTLSGQTRTLKARFVLPNPGAKLKPQMFAKVEMNIDMGKRLSIPETAVLDTGVRKV